VVTYAALLRGINVSGQKKILMKDLAEMFAKLGFENIITYIQSGNVVFQSNSKNNTDITAKIAKGIKKEFGFDVNTEVVDKKELQNIINRNPFLNVKGIDESKLHATLLSAAPDKENLNKIAAIDGGKDKIVIAGKTVYLYCPNGYGRTKYTNTVIENKLKVKATTRNWKTLNALLELM
jgi:uncharacterized protein (DUF1697 family)